jgi:hypothetical protein
MQNDELASYLKDHMAGSVGAVDMLEHLIESHEKEPVAQFCRELLEKVRADQAELETMMDALDISEGSVRKAGAWITEKVSRAKLKLEGEGSLVQGLEALTLGITGKKLLWRALGTVQGDWPQLQRFDLMRLERRAAEQAEQTDVQRIAAAATVFGQREGRKAERSD